MLTLFHFWSSTCSRKVRIALAEKDINWKSHHIDIVNKLENLEPEYLKINPNGVVPTLKHDGNVILESNIIIEYIDDTFPGIKLKPDDNFQRAVMRLWLETAEAKVHKNVNVVSYNKRHVPRMDKLFSKEQQREILMGLPEADGQEEGPVPAADGTEALDRLGGDAAVEVGLVRHVAALGPAPLGQIGRQLAVDQRRVAAVRGVVHHLRHAP